MAAVEEEDEVVLGIDLGTTFTCCGAWINGEVRTVTDSQGRKTLPS